MKSGSTANQTYRPRTRNPALGYLLGTLALLVLLIGQVNPDPRLTIATVPFNPLLVGFSALLVLTTGIRKWKARYVCVLLLPLMLSTLTLLWSHDPGYGAYKIANLLVVGFICSLLFIHSAEHIGWNGVGKAIVVAGAFILGGAMAYKLRFGVFDRTVPFLFQGPIVFARTMALAAIMAGFWVRAPLRWVAVAIFGAAALWTESKGPILSLAFVACCASVAVGGMRGLLAAVSVSFAGIVIVWSNWEWVQTAPFISRFMIAAEAIGGNIGSENTGSIGLRLEAYQASIALIIDRPLGVGLGGWSQGTGMHSVQYPHNFFLEMFAELGLVFAPLAIIPFFAFFRGLESPFAWAAVFFAAAQQVSGDLLDSRYWLVFSIVAAVLGADARRNRSTPRSREKFGEGARGVSKTRRYLADTRL